MNQENQPRAPHYKEVLGMMKLFAIIFMAIGFFIGVKWEKDREAKRQAKQTIESSIINTSAKESK